jgi:hypothetical protein
MSDTPPPLGDHHGSIRQSLRQIAAQPGAIVPTQPNDGGNWNFHKDRSIPPPLTSRQAALSRQRAVLA